MSLVVMLKYCFSLSALNDPDEAWHIQTGYLIRKLGYIPYSDPWSFTSTQQWYNISWLWDVFSSYIHEVSKEHNLPIVSATLYGLLLCYLYRLLPSFGKFKSDTKNIVIALAAMVLWDIWYFRPQIISYFLILYCYKLLFDSRRGEFNDLPWKFCLMVVLWVNIHGSVVIAFIILAAYTVEAYYLKEYKRLRNLIVTGLAASLMLLVNPLGYKIIYAIFRTTHSIVQDKIIEWNSFRFGIWYGFSFFISVFLIVANVRNKSFLTDKLLTYFWLFYSLTSIRFFPVVALLSSNYMMHSIDPLITKSKVTYKPYYNVIVILLVGISLWAYNKAGFNSSVDYDRLNAKKEIEYLSRHYPDIKVLNFYNIGGYVIYYGKGKLRHFIDGRAGTVFSEELLSDYLDIFYFNPGWEKILKKYDIEAAIVPKDIFIRSDVELAFRNWKEVYSAPYGKVLINVKSYRLRKSNLLY